LTPIKTITMVQNNARRVFVCIMLSSKFFDVYNIQFISEGLFIYMLSFFSHPYMSDAMTYRLVLLSIGQ
jgi:hypothetical protein